MKSYKTYKNCQAQGPPPGPTQGEDQGQVSSDSNSNSNSKVEPELYIIGFHPLTTHHPPPPSLNECLERRVLSKSCLYHHDGPQIDQG